MQIIQFENRANQRAVAKVEGNMAYPVKNIQSVRDLALWQSAIKFHWNNKLRR